VPDLIRTPPAEFGLQPLSILRARNRRAAANPIGRNVKLADLADNCDLSRIAEPTEADYQRIEKYQRAIKLIHAI
jgi:hypothetical protein